MTRKSSAQAAKVDALVEQHRRKYRERMDRSLAMAILRSVDSTTPGGFAPWHVRRKHWRTFLDLAIVAAAIVTLTWLALR